MKNEPVHHACTMGKRSPCSPRSPCSQAYHVYQVFYVARVASFVSHRQRNITENPRVRGSIPFLATMKPQVRAPAALAFFRLGQMGARDGEQLENIARATSVVRASGRAFHCSLAAFFLCPTRMQAMMRAQARLLVCRLRPGARASAKTARRLRANFDARVRTADLGRRASMYAGLWRLVPDAWVGDVLPEALLAHGAVRACGLRARN